MSLLLVLQHPLVGIDIVTTEHLAAILPNLHREGRSPQGDRESERLSLLRPLEETSEEL